MPPPIEVLVQHEQWFRALVEQSSDALALITAEGAILYASPSTVRVTGYTAEELVGTNGFDFLHPDEFERAPRQFNTILDHPGEVITVEYRMRHKDGTWHWMESNVTNLLHDSIIGAIVVNFRDITERKRAEEERAQLLARERELVRQLEAEKEALSMAQQMAEGQASERAAILEAMTEGIAVFNTNGEFRYINAAYRSLLGLEESFDPAILLFKNRSKWLGFLDLEGRSLPQEQWPMFRVLRGERLSGSNTTDLMCHTPSGKDMIVNVSGAPIYDDREQIVGGVVVFRDVTGRHRLQQQLQEDERKLRSLMESNIFGMIVSDAQGRIYETNERFAHMVGYSRDELLSQTFNWHQMIPPDSQDTQARVRQAIFSAGALPPLEKEYLRKDGSRIPVLVGATLLDKRQQHALLVIIDISQQKVAERSKQDFLSMVGHELRTPLQSIMGYIELGLLYSELLPRPLSPKMEDLFRKVERVLNQALGRVQLEAHLVEELLDVSRLERHPLDLTLQPYNLIAIVQEEVESQQQRATTGHIQLVLPSQEDVVVIVDAGRIRQVLTHYLSNALRYSPEDQRVLVRLEVEGGMVRVSVVDEGPGLTAEQQEKIWEQFYQAGAPEYRRSEGEMGLGLYIARKVIEHHGGKVGVESSPGHGSTFWFTLPIADELK